MNHLTEADSHSLAERLEQMRQRALAELRGAAPHADADAAAGGHEVANHADSAEAERAEDVRFAEIEIDRQRLHDIEAAQKRMAEGSYGMCVDCGGEIPHERLLAQPIAIRCAACQARTEGQRGR